MKTFVKSGGIGFNEQADGQPHWGHTCCVYEKISDGQAGTDSFLHKLQCDLLCHFLVERMRTV